MNTIDEYADFCFQLRREGTTVADLPEHLQGIDLATAYTVQDKLLSKLLTQHGGHKIGYKIGCTSVGAQKLLNTDGPVYGQMLSAWQYRSPATLKAADFTMMVIEPEFAFTVSQDVPAGSYDADSIRPFIANVIPSIEIVHHRLGDWDRFDAPTVVADNAIHGAWIGGTAETQWQNLHLPEHEVGLCADDVLVSSGRGDVVLGSPLTAMAWIANTLPLYGHTLQAGDIVTTGVCMAVYTAQPQEKMRADFGSLGCVEVVFL
jgi:2-keto-4-pentenoate hydratase